MQDDGAEVTAEIARDFAALGSPREMLLLRAEQSGRKTLHLRLPARLAPIYDGFREEPSFRLPARVQCLIGHREEFDMLFDRRPPGTA